jgi:cobyrinic acid a,c-diamide synthase
MPILNFILDRYGIKQMGAGFIVAGTHSGCGKTTVSLGLMACLRKKGYVVQAFKAGPDFIDAGLHRLVTGRPSRNLDIWMCGEDFVKSSFERHSSRADISIIEGVMGIFDGEDSTARLAQFLKVPVVLVVDAFGMAETAGAIVNGIVERATRDFKDIKFKGVVFNRVCSEAHLKRLIKGLEIPCLGYLPKDKRFSIPSRHLGLVTAEEKPITDSAIDRLAELMTKYVNIGEIVNNNSPLPPLTLRGGMKGGVIRRLAIARDKAFSFYYEDNLDILRESGFELIEFSPLNDRELPEDIDGLYIGGGYPEEYAETLSYNKELINAIKKASLEGIPIYAECGGLIYLSEGIEKNGSFFPMTGILPLRIKMQNRPVLGYREVIQMSDIGSQMSESKEKYSFKSDIRPLTSDFCLRGHEFHYSVIDGKKDCVRSRFKVHNRDGEFIMDEGFTIRNTTGTYIHLHGAWNPDAFKRLFTEE